MVLVKAMMVSTVVLSIAGAAQAADPAYTVPTSQKQAAPANPYLPYSPTRPPGPKASPSNWIPPSNLYRAPPSAHGDEGQPAHF